MSLKGVVMLEREVVGLEKQSSLSPFGIKKRVNQPAFGDQAPFTSIKDSPLQPMTESDNLVSLENST